jgi:hypothetical protein
MLRKQLRLVIYETGRRIGLREFYVVGSAAILATAPDPLDDEFTATRDVDIATIDDNEELTDRIDFLLGDGTDFDARYGVYAQGVTSRTPEFAPADWKSRTIPINVDGVVAHCMEAHDLVLSKLGAGRPKDIDFARTAARQKLISQTRLLELLPDVNCTEEVRKTIEARIQAAFFEA